MCSTSKGISQYFRYPYYTWFHSEKCSTAAAQYIAPKSLILDLKEMIMGDYFNKDTIAIDGDGTKI